MPVRKRVFRIGKEIYPSSLPAAPAAIFCKSEAGGRPAAVRLPHLAERAPPELALLKTSCIALAGIRPHGMQQRSPRERPQAACRGTSGSPSRTFVHGAAAIHFHESR